MFCQFPKHLTHTYSLWEESAAFDINEVLPDGKRKRVGEQQIYKRVCSVCGNVEKKHVKLMYKE